jgi:hypothetical protein
MAYVEAGEKAYAQPSVLVHNLSGGRFEEWKKSGDFGKARMVARGTAVADIDNDGDLDLVARHVYTIARCSSPLDIYRQP